MTYSFFWSGSLKKNLIELILKLITICYQLSFFVSFLVSIAVAFTQKSEVQIQKPQQSTWTNLLPFDVFLALDAQCLLKGSLQPLRSLVLFKSGGAIN